MSGGYLPSFGLEEEGHAGLFVLPFCAIAIQLLFRCLQYRHTILLQGYCCRDAYLPEATQSETEVIFDKWKGVALSKCRCIGAVLVTPTLSYTITLSPTLSYSRSFQTGPATILCPVAVFFPLNRCIWDSYLLSAGDDLVKFLRAALRSSFFGKPSWFLAKLDITTIIVCRISFKALLMFPIPRDWYFLRVNSGFIRYKVNYCPRNSFRTHNCSIFQHES